MQGPFIKSPVLKIVLGILSSLLAIVFILLLLFTEETRMEAQTASWAGREIENGAALYYNNCASCHGPDGRGLPGVAPALHSHYFFTERLGDVGWAGSLSDYVELTVAAGRPSKTNTQWAQMMPTWGVTYGGPLRDDQVRAVTAYVLNWEADSLTQTAEEDPWQPFRDVRKPVEQQTIGEPGEPPAEVAAPTGEPRDPEVLFTSLACIACHNLAVDQTPTNRGPVGPNFGNLNENAQTRVAGMSAEEYIHQSIVAPNAYVVEGYPSGIMPQNFDQLMSEEEINAMVTWLIEQSQQ
ncbi:MAG: cytochrome c [Caldilineaceae bacterium]|nr:cytochrome c [Caldilineaceae bacterium]